MDVYDIFENEFDLDVAYVNETYANVERVMSDLNMNAETWDVIDEVKEELKSNNIFCLYEPTIEASPTKKMIRILFEHASKAIMNRYPNAIVTYKVSGYNASFEVDRETYKKADRESEGVAE